jgi:hypothetical protein
MSNNNNRSDKLTISAEEYTLGLDSDGKFTTSQINNNNINTNSNTNGYNTITNNSLLEPSSPIFSEDFGAVSLPNSPLNNTPSNFRYKASSSNKKSPLFYNAQNNNQFNRDSYQNNGVINRSGELDTVSELEDDYVSELKKNKTNYNDNINSSDHLISENEHLKNVIHQMRSDVEQFQLEALNRSNSR